MIFLNKIIDQQVKQKDGGRTEVVFRRRCEDGTTREIGHLELSSVDYRYIEHIFTKEALEAFVMETIPESHRIPEMIVLALNEHDNFFKGKEKPQYLK